MITFKINSPFWMTAGKTLGWPDSHGDIGVGLARDRMRMDRRETVKITDKKGRVYTCPAMALYVFHQFNKTVYHVKNGKELLVFPLTMFDEQ